MIRATSPDELFGAMRIDEQRRSYEATMELTPGTKTTVTIDWMGIAPAEALKRSREIYLAVARREAEYRRGVAARLLDLYNRSWRDGDALDAEDFMRRLSLDSMVIAPLELGEAGCVTLYYAEGGLFAGHLIEVLLDEDLSFSKAQLVG